MGTLFLPFSPPPLPYTSPPVIVVIPTPSPFSPTKLTTHGPSPFSSSLCSSSSRCTLVDSDGDLSHLRHRCRRRPKIQISSIFHPTSSSLSLVFHGFFICASPPLRLRLLHHSRSATASFSITSTAAMARSTVDHRFSFLPPLPISSAAALDLPRLPSSSTPPPCLPSLPVLFTSTAHLLPLLSSSRSRRRCSRRPPASSPILAVTPAPHSPPPSPSSSVSVLIASLDGTAVAFSAVASSLPRFHRGLDPVVLMVSPFPCSVELAGMRKMISFLRWVNGPDGVQSRASLS